MIKIDTLSSNMGIDYMPLFHKVAKFHNPKNSTVKESERLRKIFTQEESDFLACIALEYLSVNGIDAPYKFKDLQKDETDE